MTSLEQTGRTIEEATQKALKQLGVIEEDVDVEILEEGARGFLGIGQTRAKVRVTMKRRPMPEAPPDPPARERRPRQAPRDERPPREQQAPREERPARQRQAPREERPPREQQAPREERPARQRQAPREERPPREQQAPREERPPREQQAPREERPPRQQRPPRQRPAAKERPEPRPAAPPPPPELPKPSPEVTALPAPEPVAAIPMAEIMQSAGEISLDALQHIADGIEDGAKASVKSSADGQVVLEILSGEPATIIGKHGQTIDAIQYLVGVITNKQLPEKVRVVVDVEGYRSRREEALTNQAHYLASQVRETGEEAVLEPLHANERRIIHSALADDPDVYTYSEGEEPDRHVVISPKK